MANKRGRLVIISGPSGAGKTSICDGLLARLPNAVWSVSVTTRAKRGHELDGQHYHFIDRNEYERMIAAGELLEHAEYLGKGYGTPVKFVREAVEEGKFPILEIDVQGGAQVAQRCPDSIRVFVLPPTIDSLRARLEGRRTESEELQRQRLAKADGEIGFAQTSGCYQYFITNDILEDSIQRVMDIIGQEMKTHD